MLCIFYNELQAEPYYQDSKEVYSLSTPTPTPVSKEKEQHVLGKEFIS